MQLRDERLGLLIALCLLASGCTLPDREERENQFDIPLLATYASDVDGDSWGLNLLFGIFQTEAWQEGSHTHFFPFFFNTEGPGDDTFLLVPPFFYLNKKPFLEDRFFFLFGTRKQGSRTTYHVPFPFIRLSPRDDADRWRFLLFPLVDVERDGPKGRLDVLNVLELVKLFHHRWGHPPEPGEEGTRGAFRVLNLLNLIQLAGGSDLGAYEDFQLVTLFGSERISLFQRHWRRDGEEGRTILFPLYWHFRKGAEQSRHYWPLYSTAQGPGWNRQGVLSNMFTLRSEGRRKTLKLLWFIPISWGEESENSLESQ